MAQFNIGFIQPKTVLELVGDDAASFLQGQFTNDLRAKGRKSACTYGLWLNAKGKVLADSFVLTIESQRFLLISYFSEPAVLKARLEAFIIADDVTVTDVTSNWMTAVILGDGAASIFEAAKMVVPLPGEYSQQDGEIVFRGRRSRGKNFEWIIPSTEYAAKAQRLADIAAAQGGEVISNEDLERYRILDGIAAIPRDIGPNDLPNEGGLDQDAIAYDKGCYTGQEVMARLKSMGQVRRSLMRVGGTGSAPALPAPIFQSGKKVGELRSAAPVSEEKYLGLAMVTKIGTDFSQPLSLSENGEPALHFSAGARALS